MGARSPGGSGIIGFFSELRRRHVIRVAIIYVVVGIGVIEAADLLFPRLGLPNWAVQLVLGLTLVGFPIALVLAWALELTPDGPRSQASVDVPAAPPEPTPTPGVPEPDPAMAASPASGRDTLLVFPFDNISPDEENEYFSDGLTEEIIASLSRIRALGVISRTSAMRLKGADRDIPVIRRDLGVRYVLEGSVRKSGPNLRITAQLIDAATDQHLWAENYSGTTEDIFAIQEGVATAIAGALRIELTPEEERSLARSAIEDPVAHESYLRARHEMWRFSRDGLEKARRHIENALELVGENELLLATLGHIDVWYLQAGIDADPKHLEDAERCADAIFRLNPDSRHGHRLLGMIRFSAGDLRAARPHMETALERAPDDPDALASLGYVLSLRGQDERGLALFERLLEIDPLTPLNHAMPGFVAHLQGRFEDSLAPYRTFLRMDDGGPFSMAMWVWALCANGTPDEAEPTLEELVRAHPDELLTAAAKGLFHGARGDRDAAAGVVSPALQEAARSSEMYSRFLAQIYAMAGDVERSLDYLERTVAIGLAHYPYLSRHDPFLGQVRETPRFERLMEKVKAEWDAARGESTRQADGGG